MTSTASRRWRSGSSGPGKMATALARGWLAAGLVTADHLPGQRPRARRPRRRSSERPAARATADNREVVAASDVLVLAVKPQSMAALLAEIRTRSTARHLVVSIAAGVTLQQLADGLGAPTAGSSA